jgi:hypothetical protein
VVPAAIDVFEPEKQGAAAGEDSEQLDRSGGLLLFRPERAVVLSEHGEQPRHQVRVRRIARLGEHASHPGRPPRRGEVRDPEDLFEETTEGLGTRAFAAEPNVVGTSETKFLDDRR